MNSKEALEKLKLLQAQINSFKDIENHHHTEHLDNLEILSSELKNKKRNASRDYNNCPNGQCYGYGQTKITGCRL